MNDLRPCPHPRADHQHGTYLAYLKDGCRCTACVTANRSHAKAVRYRTVTATHTYVPAGAARAHVQELLATLTLGQVEQRSGVHRTSIRVLVGTFPGRPASKRIARTTEAALLAVRADRVGPEEHGLVDGTGTRRRLRALVTLGWPLRQLGTRLGCSSRTLWVLTTPDVDDTDPVLTRTRQAVRDLYDDLSLTIPPPSRTTTAARNLATARGWAPPLAWDDDTIDDPAARPQHDATGDAGDVDDAAVERAIRGESVILTRAERWAVLERLVAQGLSDSAIAARVGVSDRTVERDRRALDLESQWARRTQAAA